MTSDQRSTAILLAALTIPFGIAVYQDATAAETDDHRGLGYADEALGLDDPYDYDDDFDYDDNYELQALEALEAVPDAMSVDFFASVLYDGGSAKAPTLAGPLAGLRTNKTLGNVPEQYESWSYDGIPGYEHAYLSVSTRYRFYISFPDDGLALRSMTAQWGQPTVSDDDYEKVFSWVNSSEDLRAQLRRPEYSDTAEITIERYLTMEDFVSPDAKIFGFEDSDVFALSPQELSQVADFSYGEASIVLPSLENVEAGVSLAIETEAGEVVSMSCDMYLDAEESEKFLGLMKKKFGAAKKSEDDWNTVYTFAKGKRIVELSVDDTWHNMVIRRR